MGKTSKKNSVGKANAEDASTYRRLRRRRCLVDRLSMAPQIAESPLLAGRGHSTRRVAAVLRKGQAALVLSLNSAFWGWSRVRRRGGDGLCRGCQHRRAYAEDASTAAPRPVPAPPRFRLPVRRRRPQAQSL